MLYQNVIAAKRDGHLLTPQQIATMVQGMTDGSLSDAQLGAFAMAVLLRGMDATETAHLTTAMRDSGRILTWDSHPVLDKHSTGGVGDAVSLVLAPALAACGVVVPMISGRGLGHTGGTLDKLEAMPGYTTSVDLARLRSVVATAGCAIVGASAELAPADRRFYAVRDVTATVESRALIVASILSKKLAAGLDGLVLDVKIGSGAFMTDPEEAVTLARTLVDVATRAGCPARAVLSDMSQPLAPAAGNAVELSVALDLLRGQVHAAPRLYDMVLTLGAEALALAGLDDGQARIDRAIRTGQAAERFARMVAALGGPRNILDRPQDYLPTAPVLRPVTAPRPGVVAAYDGRAIGQAVIALGGGRRAAEDRIDPRVGFSDILPLGTPVNVGDRLAMVHAATDSAADAAGAAFLAATRIGPTANVPMLVQQVIS